MDNNMNTNIQETNLERKLNNAPQMNGRKPIALIIVLCCVAFILTAGAVSTCMHKRAHLYGELEWDDVRMTVDQPLEGLIRIKVFNDSGSDLNFGWVDQSTVILNTTEGTDTFKVRQEIGDRSTGNVCVVFPNASGIPQSITFDSVGMGLGADSSIQMNLSLSGEGEKSLRAMNIFEKIWGYVRWAFYWIISFSFSDFHGMVNRAIAIIITAGVLVLVISLLLPRKMTRARVLKRYVETTTHYQNGMPAGTTTSYMVIFQLEDGKRRKVNVRSRYHYDQLCYDGWGLLTMKGAIFVKFEYLPAFS